VSATASIVLGILAMLGYGVEDVLAKTMLSNRNAIRIAMVSQAIGISLFLVVALSCDLALPSLTVIYLALVSGAISAVVLGSYYLALSMGKASIVSPILSCMNVVAVALSLWVLGESLTGLQLSLISLVFVGILLVAFERSESKDSARKLSVLLALLAAVLGGGNIIIQKWISESSHYLMAFFLSRALMVSFMLPISPLTRETRPEMTARSYVKLGVLGLMDVSAFFCWYIGLRVGQVSIVTPIVLSSPAVTVILAHIFLNERVQLHQRLGILAVVAGIVLLSLIS
jgi:drug/metabolite transporter (DMT)-like permease